MQVGSLLGLDQLADELGRGDDPAQTDTGREDFRERAQVDDVARIAGLVAALLCGKL
jgi:hypothetical protein